MIIVDLNQIMYSSILQDKMNINEGLVRHIALNTLRSIKKKFIDGGELVIASDSYKYWRKECFPYYKANRKRAREKSNLNWQNIFSCMNNMKQELKDIRLYKYLEVEGAEADDIIATLANYITDQEVIIVSGDKDFAQLQKNSNVKQYDILNKRYLRVSNPLMVLEEHILKGDVGDGIPNVLSEDNCFVMGQRQKKLTKKIQQSLVGISFNPDHDHYRNYMRNKRLIDLDMIPDKIKSDILMAYNCDEKYDRSKLLNYLIKNRLNVLLQSINDF